MKRRIFCRISGLAAGMLFLPAPLRSHAAALPDDATLIFEALHTHGAGDCPAHHHEGLADLVLPLPENVYSSRVVSMEQVGTHGSDGGALAELDPDPFISTATFSFALAAPGFVDMRVYDRWGRRVATLVEEHLPAGAYRLVWEAPDLAEGTYQYVLEAGSFLQARRMTVGAGSAV